MKNFLIESSRLQLRRADLSDLPYILHLQLKPENLKFIVPFDENFHTQIITSDCKSKMDVIVEERETSKPVGYFMLSELDNPHNKVEITHVIIDKKNCGYGKESLQALLKWIFTVKNFHRAFLDCKTYNEVALHLYDKIGFKREGILREHILTDGVYEDLIILGMLKNEYLVIGK